MKDCLKLKPSESLVKFKGSPRVKISELDFKKREAFRLIQKVRQRKTDNLMFHHGHQPKRRDKKNSLLANFGQKNRLSGGGRRA